MSNTSLQLTNGEIFSTMMEMQHEQMVFCTDKTTGLKAIIAIHNTTLGSALGGTRFWNYTNEDDAIIDVLRLSRGMTYKAAISGLNLTVNLYFVVTASLLTPSTVNTLLRKM